MPVTPEGYERLDEARDRLGSDQLASALGGGSLQAYRLDSLGSLHPIEPSSWRTEQASEVIQSGRTIGAYSKVHRSRGIGDIVYVRRVLEHSQGKDETKSAKNKGGNPGKYDWDRVFVECACSIATDGVPKTQSEFIERIQQRLGSKSPGLTEMKTRVGPLFNAVKRAMDWSET